ncbi:ribosomal L7Ae/L30e/S12e/Gadd45 family protein [Lachnospiraceae bacterium NSJ-143]|nr:ribosomal L7Ae/L30e/S12e/Gadd45 family protein [Lachnospiraceae bacterium NSJ-143]
MGQTVNKFFSMLGLCQRAGKLISGELSCENAVKSGKAKLLIIADDASENTKKKFSNMASFYKVDIIGTGTKKEIGRIIGKDMRSSVAITDEGFAQQLKKLMASERV